LEHNNTTGCDENAISKTPEKIHFQIADFQRVFVTPAEGQGGLGPH
jgi:hypothetical protein